MSQAPAATVPSTLLPEILDLSPQLLLDDIVNHANDAISLTVDAMEAFLLRWAENRTDAAGQEWDSTQEIEQGLVAFQTLLEMHTDIAFDVFEGWSLRNIFAIPEGLPIVVPHQKGLNLEHPPQKEAELMAEIDILRRKIDAQRLYNRLQSKAARISAIKKRRAEERVEKISFLKSPAFQELSKLADDFQAMSRSMSSLPEMDTKTIAALTRPHTTEPGKRPWEMSETGYSRWAVRQLVARANAGEGSSTVDALVETMSSGGKTEEIAALRDVIEPSMVSSRQDDGDGAVPDAEDVEMDE